MRRTFAQSARLKLQGIAFLLVIAGAVFYLVAVFNKTFVDSRDVTLVVPSAGNQLNSNADVKIRGKLVGRVSKQVTNGNELTITLALTPSDFHYVPANVTAAILPKTLFGEKYVDLLIPESGPVGSLAVGAKVPQDTSTTTVELEKVLGDLFPVLKAVKPQDLNQSLDAISTALTGNGNNLGANLVNGGDYLAQLQPSLPGALDDLAALNTFANTLNGGTNCTDTSSAQAKDPNTVVGCLVGFLKNTTTTSATVLDQNDVLTQFLSGTSTFTVDLTQFLTTNQDRVIQVAATSRPGLELLAQDNPLIKPAVDRLLDVLEALSHPGGPLDQGPYVDLMAQIPSSTGDPGGYTAAADCPVYPGVSGLPPLFGPNCPASITTARSAGTSTTAKPAVVGSKAEKQQIAAVVAVASGVPADAVPDAADLIVGGVLRGTTVHVGGR